MQIPTSQPYRSPADYFHEESIAYIGKFCDYDVFLYSNSYFIVKNILDIVQNRVAFPSIWFNSLL